MSYRQCFFAFPVSDWDRDTVLDLARKAAFDLASQLDLPAIYVRLNDATWARECGAWLMIFGTTRDSDRVLERGYFLDAWSEAGTYSVFCHDDSNGLYLFRHVHPTRGFSIGSRYAEDGLILSGDVDRVTVRPDQDAVSLGIATVYGESLRYLDLLYTSTAWRLYDPDAFVAAPEEVAAPLALRNYVDAWPGDDLDDRTASTPESADAIAPDDLLGRYNRACACALRGDRDGMLADLRAVLAVQPEDAEDVASDDDFARFHDDREVLAMIAEARARTGRPDLPMGLRLEITSTHDQAYAVLAVPPDGVVLLRIAYYPYAEARLAELARLPPPDAITPEACAAYAARLAAEIAKHEDLVVSVLALGATGRGLCGWLCGVARVWRVGDNEIVSPTPYVEIPPGVDLPPTLIRRSVMRDGARDAAWFEAPGKAFAIAMAHPLDEDITTDVEVGIAGTWRLSTRRVTTRRA